MFKIQQEMYVTNLLALSSRAFKLATRANIKIDDYQIWWGLPCKVFEMDKAHYAWVEWLEDHKQLILAMKYVHATKGFPFGQL